jgi:hypothetical protein
MHILPQHTWEELQRLASSAQVGMAELEEEELLLELLELLSLELELEVLLLLLSLEEEEELEELLAEPVQTLAVQVAPAKHC